MKALFISTVFVAGIAMITHSANKSIPQLAKPSPASSTQKTAYDYDLDWQNIKTAILDKDVQTLANYTANDELDVESVIEMIHADEEFLNLFKNINYEDLTIQEDESGVVFLVASMFISGTTEDGYEYESGIYLYFAQEENLFLVDVLAAG